MGRVCCLFSHTVLWRLETLNNCDIIKPNCERPLNRVCVCDAIQPLGCLLFPSDRRLVKTHSGTSSLRPQPTSQVLRFHSFFSSQIPPFFSSASVSATVCSPSPYQLLFTGPNCVSGSSNYKPLLASFIFLNSLFYTWFKGPHIHLLKLQWQAPGPEQIQYTKQLLRLSQRPWQYR